VPAGHKKYALVAAVVVVGLAGASIALWPDTSGQPASVRHARQSARRSADWDLIQAAASLRGNALARDRTAFHRAFAAYMGLSALLQIRDGLRGRCATAVRYLYDNLLDLHDAYTGEDWTALRQDVAREPSLGVCAPCRAAPRAHVRYVE
jgi:hypothetical protein